MYGQRWPQRHLPPEPPGFTLCVHERKDALSLLRAPHAAAICSGKAAGTGLPRCPRPRDRAGRGRPEPAQVGWELCHRAQRCHQSHRAQPPLGSWSTRSKEALGCTRCSVPPGTPPGTSAGAGGCWIIPGSMRQARLGLTRGNLLMFGGPTVPAVLVIPDVSAIIPIPVHLLFSRT